MTLVFNKDRNVRQKDYKNLQEREILITKIFGPTIQGEGPFAGHPAVFIRLAGCNLGAKQSCPWCDSAFFFSQGEVYTVDMVISSARGKAPPHQLTPLAIITGGEPFMQPNTPELISYLLLDDWTVQVETNGYFWNDKLRGMCGQAWETGKNLYIVVSPKVNARNQYPKLNYSLLNYASCLKILVDSDPLSPYHEIPAFAHSYSSQYCKPVYVSPLNYYLREPHPNEETVSGWGPDTPLDLEKSKRNATYAAELAVKYGYRLSMQMHLWAVMP